MKQFTKLMAVCLVTGLIVCSLAIPVSAAGVVSISVTGESETAFEDPWEFSVNVSSNGTAIGVIVYGYDTAWINEDYVWTKSFTGDSQAGVYRPGKDSSTNWGPKKGENTYSKIEVHHNSNTVVNYAFFSAAGESVTLSLPYASNVK